MFQNVPLKGLLFVVLLFTVFNINAQPLLPDIAVSMDKGINIISWSCQYDGLKSIAVQRSTDSVHNYTTIGYVKSLKKGTQAYIDGHPVPGKNWYRLYIVFGSQLTWYSNRVKIKVDSSVILNKRVLPPNDSLQKLVETLRFEPGSTTTNISSDIAKTEKLEKLNTRINGIETDTLILSPGLNEVTIAPPPPKITIDIPEPSEDEGFSYAQSQYVYSDPFSGHVNIDIADCFKHTYNIIFINQDNKKVLEVERVTEPKIIMDKRNFRKKGIYKFELRKDRKILETGHISIF